MAGLGIDARVSEGSGAIIGREMLKSSPHASWLPRDPPRSTVDDRVTFVGRISTGTVSLSLRGPFTHHIVYRDRSGMTRSSVVIELVRLMPGRLAEARDWVVCRN